jgi:hypothetical protein
MKNNISRGWFLPTDSFSFTTPDGVFLFVCELKCFFCLIFIHSVGYVVVVKEGKTRVLHAQTTHTRDRRSVVVSLVSKHFNCWITFLLKRNGELNNSTTILSSNRHFLFHSLTRAFLAMAIVASRQSCYALFTDESKGRFFFVLLGSN